MGGFGVAAVCGDGVAVVCDDGLNGGEQNKRYVNR